MFDLESLLAPLSDDAPSGLDLEYDAVFLALQQVGAGKPEQQFGDTVIAAEPPDWRAVQQHAMDLSARTRDLRLAVWLTRCGARLEDFQGAVRGLELIQGLLERLWDTVHPQLDASDNNDPTMRLNALAPLTSVVGLLSDLRAAAITGVRGGPTVRNLELGLGLAEAAEGEPQPTETGILEGLRQCIEQEPEVAVRFERALAAGQAIANVLDQQLGGANAPDLEPLLRLLRGLQKASQRVSGGDQAGAEAIEASDAASGQSPVVSRQTVAVAGSIASRDDVVRQIDRLCEWIERNEPSNPAPLMLRRAQRLMTMSFVDIVKDMVPDGLEQIERLAGVDLRS